MEEYCIISDGKRNVAKEYLEGMKVAVLVHLFYEDQVDFYQEYIKRIPVFVDVIIFSSKDIILKMFDDTYIKIKKKNQGRDISALLVTARDIIPNYEYVCFVHDKKEKKLEAKADTDFWIRTLWDNMLQSETYIYNILEFLANCNEVGMLVPPPPHGRDFGTWLNREWGPNYEKTQEMADELGVKVNIYRDCPPITYGTVFWAKTKAIVKLFFKDWRYEDFPLEPMKDNGEINHAMERILQYVVEDAGYETRIVLSSSFTTCFIKKLHDEFNALWEQLDSTVGIRSYKELDYFQNRVEKIKRFRNAHEDIYLYGIGKVGRRCLRICRILDIIPKGIIVTQPEKGQSIVNDIPVIGISDFAYTKRVGIIISVSEKSQMEIVNELKKRNIESYIIY
jgi:Lipopolysaccharide biosynthesis protein